MATIKSYTDLEQSKKLAKILPLESADMVYIASANDDIGDILYTAEYKSEIILMEDDADYINCWSLAALLSVVSEEVSLNSFKDGNWNAMVQQNGKMIYGDANNSVDACVEMIIKLHEQNLL